jgi:hypothetical protein
MSLKHSIDCSISKLLKLLPKRELPGYIVRVLVNLYTQNSVRITWGETMSEKYSYC